MVEGWAMTLRTSSSLIMCKMTVAPAQAETTDRAAASAVSFMRDAMVAIDRRRSMVWILGAW